ncbi:MAG: hypothetical protein CFE21_04335 [Bacteroidetes bacterium B1(2017)]|nr:MAG: hypothetical protein CFE21_04335 [Bacteroidetes bacterium B1(2017)]
MKQVSKLAIYILLLIPQISWAQEQFDWNLIPSNQIHNSESISGILNQLKGDSVQTFSIVHLGDSHIQADFFGAKMRKLLQSTYGNSGRGFVFPYSFAKTNGHADARFIGPKENWQIQRITKADSGNFIGIPGYQLTLTDPNTEVFTFKYIPDSSLFDAEISELVMLYQGEASFSFGSNESSFSLINESKNVGNLLNQQSFKIVPGVLSFEVTISHSQNFVFHGMILRNNRKGVQYHSVGVNGATLKNYNQSAVLLSQLSVLNPQLLIVSLGTNESVSKIDSLSFTNQLAQLVQTAKTELHCGILFTTPADNYLRKKTRHKKKTRIQYYDNPKAKEIGDWMIAFCEHEGIAYWDMYEALGGKGSMKEMVATGLAAKDHIHFSRKGYHVQASLFFEALKRSIN